MTKNVKRFFSLVLALSMLFGLALPAAATESDAVAVKTEDVSKELNVEVSVDKDALEAVDVEFDFDFANVLLMTSEDVEVDKEDPTIIAFESELDSFKVLNAEGESVPLTAEQKKEILDLYQRYLDHWAANANLLGVQTPFFLSYNDSKDNLGILGEMLVLANIPLDAVRGGYVSYDDIIGMIQNFLYADAIGVQVYGQTIKSARDEVLNLVKNSGAQTDPQKYMVINNWLAQNVVFDMPYIMNSDKEEGKKPMVAPTPQKHEYYDVVYNAIYGDYEASIRATFEQNINDGLKAEMQKQFYVAAIEAAFSSGIWNAVIEQFYIQGMMQQGLDEATATAQAKAVVEADAEAISADPYAYCVEKFGEEGAAQAQAVVDEQVAGQMAQNEAAINADPVAFVQNAFGAEAAAQFAAMWNQTWADWEANGIPGMVAMFSAEMWPAIIEQFYLQGMMQQGMDEATAKQYTAAQMEADAAAISADPYAYCVAAFGQEGADQAQAIVNDELSKMGIDGSTTTNPEGRVMMAVILALQMDTPQQDPMLQLPDGSYMTPNQAIAVFADQAAVGLTEGVLNYWQGSLFGALGRGSAVCLGYTKAFAYLVQCLKSDVYTNGRGIDTASNWKTAKDLYYDNRNRLDISKNYVVDCVRITFDTDVTMYGQTEEGFNSDHFWNAVKVDGKWYYIDPCYVDAYTEVMIRDRVETDGSNNYMYFMFSHTTTTSLYDGYYSEIKTLYADAATHTDYEDSWMSRVKSNPYFNGGYAYYVYDSTDMISMLDMSNNTQDMESFDMEMDDSTYKIVRHKLTTTDAVIPNEDTNGDTTEDGTTEDGTTEGETTVETINGDNDYETLIEFNYKENEDDDETVARVKNSSGNMVKNDQLTKLYAQHEEDVAKYPSLALTAVFYNNKIYFNLSNTILSYDISSGAIAVVKEYNTVSATRDKTNAFGGMAFSVVSDGGDFTVQNHPIAGLALKNDGKLYVSIATNFAFISGKDPHNSADQGSYGYEFEESNFNKDYNSYTNDQMGQYESMGYEKEINDNDEFMWSANFVETLSMSHFAGSSHSYANVSVDATCGHNAFTEQRCSTCGAIKSNSRSEVRNSAHDHHYIRFDETYYTKDNSKNWNTGFCYICTECLFAIEEPSEPDRNADYESSGTTYEEQLAIYKEEKAIYDAAAKSAGHVISITDAEWAEDYSAVTFSKIQCESSACSARQSILDCLVNDKKVNFTFDPAVKVETVKTIVGTCPDGVTETYVASGTVDVGGEDFPYEFSKELRHNRTECKYVDGVCSVCGDCTVKRISGDNRIATALAVATELKAVLGVNKFDAIIIAAGGTGSDNTKFADALSGSYLASVKKAPILLYTKGDLAEENLTFIRNNLRRNGTIYLLGGEAAVPAEVETALAGYTIKRLKGDDRYETNRVILNEVGLDSAEEILIATGTNFADCLSASATGLPIMLVKGTATELNEQQIEFLSGLKDKKFTILGGEAAVSAELEAAIEELIGADVERIKGEKREETSTLIAKKYFPEADFALVAYSKNYPDGLAGGVLANALGAPLLLTNTGNEKYAVAYNEETGIEGGYILGGTSVVTDETAKIVFALADNAVIKQK